MPTSLQAFFLLRTYTCEAGSAPTRITARQGAALPLAIRCWIPSATLRRTSAATCLPSIVLALILQMLSYIQFLLRQILSWLACSAKLNRCCGRCICLDSSQTACFWMFFVRNPFISLKKVKKVLTVQNGLYNIRTTLNGDANKHRKRRAVAALRSGNKRRP